MSEAGDAESGELGGYGFSLRTTLSRDLETAGKKVFVISVIDRGGPAYASGLRADDVVEKVDGEHILSWGDAARLLLAPAESWSQVTWYRPPASARLSSRIRRRTCVSQDLMLLREAQHREPHPEHAAAVGSSGGAGGRRSSKGIKGVFGWVKRSKVGQVGRALLGEQILTAPRQRSDILLSEGDEYAEEGGHAPTRGRAG
ncbi:hypothetical protein T484DRAFT_1884937 [Baffinella frigidus]|nr:hypothetical protein T484DRAFT_1884937 [Cryptophyta sp. CCMP2293]